ncbi:MAG: hypothetical protein KDI62_28770, partial [Anaerolineae bacterium]|nr:hypothetical protein [Anaerolineae bacterium]
ETLFGSPEIGAEAIHTIYKRTVLTEGRPPFLAVRAAFQSPSLLWGVQEQLQAHQAEERITNDEGDILQPNYTVVDPYTFFFLLKRYLNEQP